MSIEAIFGRFAKLCMEIALTPSPRRHALARWVLAVLALQPALVARSHRRDFPVTYDWWQPARHEKEIELRSLIRPHGDITEELEFETGVTDRFSIAPYAVFQRSPGETLAFKEWRLESRYRLGRYRTGSVLPGLYLEYEKANGQHPELEARLILSRFTSDGATLSANLIGHHDLARGARLESSYTLGYARPLTGLKGGIRAGAEWTHDLTGGLMTFGPVMGADGGHGVKGVVGAGFPIRRGRGAEIRFLVEYEWF